MSYNDVMVSQFVVAGLNLNSSTIMIFVVITPIRRGVSVKRVHSAQYC